MYYLIEETLKECSAAERREGKAQYVAVLTPDEWLREKDSFEMGIDLDFDFCEIHSTKAEVNYDSVTGTFAVPDRTDMENEPKKFAFALDEKGIVFIDPEDTVAKNIARIKTSKKWRFPSLERFIYDFLEQIVKDDLPLLESYEKELDAIDKDVENDDDPDMARLGDIRYYLRDLRVHYDHLIDMAQEFEENENNFFKAENLRFFKLFSGRVSRLFDIVNSLLEYNAQIRDTYKSRLDVKQNHIMTVLTVVTTIFMPLTLIVGWYGMNFKYMPELNSPMGYPVVIAVSALIVVFSLIFFKVKKWL